MPVVYNDTISVVMVRSVAVGDVAIPSVLLFLKFRSLLLFRSFVLT